MKVILFTGSHPRHLYMAKKLHQANLLSGLILEKREEFLPSPPNGIPQVDIENFIRHFRDRSDAEYRFFGKAESYDLDTIPTLSVSLQDLNSIATLEWVKDNEPDVVLTYGVHKISSEILGHFPEYSWNIHGGLSPWYRGNITLFWPFYFLQPNWAGMTIHHLTAKLDAGPIIHHSVPKLAHGDGIHDVACKAVQQVSEDLVSILEMLQKNIKVEGVVQKSSGKLFISQDWKPQHLRLIYNTFNNDIVDRYLDGELGHHVPPVVKAFQL
jgi:folate-dependent phosphoribosylglycinamide formyltransferase PurN